MKKALLYLLLFSYATIICKPILPSLSDCIAHIFWYSDHIATVHYEHGKYHVHYENVNESKKGYPEKNNTLKSDELSNVHLFNSYKYDFFTYPVSKNYFISPSANLTAGFSGSNYPPPKA
jgi:hypothetical protein